MGLHRRLQHLCQQVGSLDLRFRQPAHEAAFQEHFGQHITRNGSLGILASVIAVLISTIPKLGTEERRHTFEWDSDDPRTLFFCIRFTSVFLGLLFTILSFLHWRCGMLRTWNWELVAVFVACWWMSPTSLSNWHVTQLAGRDPQELWGIQTEGDYFTHVLVMDAVITACCLFIPIRCCMLWVITAWGVLSFYSISTITGSPFPEAHRSISITFFLLSIFAYVGAMRNEVYARKEWQAQRQVIESQAVVVKQRRCISDRDKVVSSMEAVIEAICDIVVDLKADLRTCNTNRSHTAFFGIDMHTQPFTEVLNGNDLKRFRDLLHRLQKDVLPQSLPVTLILHSKQVEANLLAVSTGIAEPCYIIGIRCDQHVDVSIVADEFVEPSPKTGPLEKALSLENVLALASAMSLPGEASELPIVNMAKTFGKDHIDQVSSKSTAMPTVTLPGGFSEYCETHRVQEATTQNHECESLASAVTFHTAPLCNPERVPGSSPWTSISVVGLGMGNYRMVRLAGKGAQGSVYEVKDETGQTFALKRISLLGKIWQEDFGNNLRAADREVRMLKSLNWASEVVVHLQECWIQSDMKTACIVMEWLPKTISGVLAKRLKAGRGFAPLNDVRRWLSCMALGIAAIHSVGWMHRDIKTNNMLLTEDEKMCKVADLGIGRQMHEPPEQQDGVFESASTCETASVLTGYTENKGTIAYMSPEALAPGGLYGQPSDIYGLGCVLLELLVGSAKFNEATEKGFSDHAAKATLEANDQWHCFDEDRNIFANLKKLCLQMLHPGIADRLTARMILQSEVLKVYVEELIQRSPSLGKLSACVDE